MKWHMVTRLRPVDMKLAYEDRPFKLGEKVDLVVELLPNRDVEVREGRVDLVCEERYTEVYTVMVTPRRSRPVISPAGVILPPRIPKQVTKEHRETYIHSSVLFLTDTRLRSGMPNRYTVTLEIESEPPPHTAQGTVKWSLVAALDVAHARDIKARRAVKVELA